jgi:3-methylfumaryl-CoA hydratase
MSDDIEQLKQWIGREETTTDYVTAPAVHRLAATLDRDEAMPKLGRPLPTGWHCVLFPRVVRHSQIGGDGHPRLGDFLPPVPLPRRMFAGKRITFHDDLLVGDEVQKRSVIKSITPKTGRSGQMVFVTVVAEISSSRGLAITEEQDIVYREETGKNAPPAAPQPAPAQAVWDKTITPDTVMLFRYSALTFNGHRIHYDLPYVTQTEGYPTLLMNGGLTTLLVFELARAQGKTIRYIASRNVRPLFVNRPISIQGAPESDGMRAKLWALDNTGALALSAEAQFS